MNTSCNDRIFRQRWVVPLVFLMAFSLVSCDDLLDWFNGDDDEPEIELHFGEVDDANGNRYETVRINQVEWMAENLRVRIYNNATPIPYPGNDNEAWNETRTGAHAFYNHDVPGGNAYGALYNHYAVTHGARICPPGFHVPSRSDFEQLIELLGGASVAGGKLKSTRTAPAAAPRWNLPNTDATDEVSFKGVPAGIRYPDGTFNYLGIRGYFWTSTTHDPYPDQAYFFTLEHDSGIIGFGPTYKTAGMSLRCIRVH